MLEEVPDKGTAPVDFVVEADVVEVDPKPVPDSCL